jgi:hypothetical protein
MSTLMKQTTKIKTKQITSLEAKTSNANANYAAILPMPTGDPTLTLT